MKAEIIFITFALLTTGCLKSKKGSNAPAAAPAPVAQNPTVEDPKTTEVVISEIKTTTAAIAVKNFEQYYKTLSKLTGIDQYFAEANYTPVYGEYKTIQAQLAIDNDASSFSSFNQIAATRLAFAFCDPFVDKDVEFKGNVPNIAQNSPEEISDALLERFLDSKPEEITGYDSLRSELVSIIENKVVYDGERETQLIPSGNNVALAKVACAALLSSSYFVVLN